jgi:hypothetical protein
MVQGSVHGAQLLKDSYQYPFLSIISGNKFFTLPAIGSRINFVHICYSKGFLNSLKLSTFVSEM